MLFEYINRISFLYLKFLKLDSLHAQLSQRCDLSLFLSHSYPRTHLRAEYLNMPESSASNRELSLGLEFGCPYVRSARKSAFALKCVFSCRIIDSRDSFVAASNPSARIARELS